MPKIFASLNKKDHPHIDKPPVQSKWNDRLFLLSNPLSGSRCILTNTTHKTEEQAIQLVDVDECAHDLQIPHFALNFHP